MADLWGNEIAQAPENSESSTHWKTRIFVILLHRVSSIHNLEITICFCELSPASSVNKRAKFWLNNFSNIYLPCWWVNLFLLSSGNSVISFGHLLFNTHSWPFRNFLRTVIQIYLGQKDGPRVWKRGLWGILWIRSFPGIFPSGSTESSSILHYYCKQKIGHSFVGNGKHPVTEKFEWEVFVFILFFMATDSVLFCNFCKLEE